MRRRRTKMKLDVDSGDRFIRFVDQVTREDSEGLHEAFKHYGDSWKKRGGQGAFLTLVRPWDRMHLALANLERVGRKWDIFYAIANLTFRDGVIDNVRDLRRYLTLVEAEMLARGFRRIHRDNAKNEKNEKKAKRRK